MGKQLFNTFWYGPTLSPMHWACLNSFVQRGHQLRVFGYQEVKLPKGVQFENASQILDEKELFEFNNSFSAFSNTFRYKFLHEQGGWWVDTDVYCLKDDISDCTYAWANQDVDLINGAILKFPPGDPALKTILDDALKIGRNIKIWGEMGPRLLTKHLSGRVFDQHYGNTNAFYPIHHLETHLFWMANGAQAVLTRCQNSSFVHLWGSLFKRLGIDPHAPVPEGSFLQWIYERAEIQDTMPPMEQSLEQKTLASINADLSRRKEHQRRILGYEVSTIELPPLNRS